MEGASRRRVDDWETFKSASLHRVGTLDTSVLWCQPEPRFVKRIVKLILNIESGTTA